MQTPHQRKRCWTANPSSSGDEEDTAKAVTAAHAIDTEIKGLIHIARQLEGDRKEQLRIIARKLEKRHEEMRQNILQQAAQIDVLCKELHYARKEYLDLNKKKHGTAAAANAKKSCTHRRTPLKFVDDEAGDDDDGDE